MKYIILEGGSPEELEKKINEAMTPPGCQLIGGVSVVQTIDPWPDEYGTLRYNTDMLYTQAILKVS